MIDVLGTCKVCQGERGKEGFISLFILRTSLREIIMRYLYSSNATKALFTWINEKI